MAHAVSDDQIHPDRLRAITEQAKSLCNSTGEYVEALKFMRETRILVVTEEAARKIADKVSKGCDGAARRYSQMLTLLKTVGLSDRRALEIALEFSSYPTDVQVNFAEIFNRAFLSEFFDYDYRMAVELAYELSKNYKGEPALVREDFIELARFCRDTKDLDLPRQLCAELAIRLARLSQFFPQGVKAPFYRLFNELRNKREFSLDVKTALEITYNVLKGGPKAPENFFAAYAFATRKEGLDYDHSAALSFAVKMAKRSHVGEEPPPIPAVVNPRSSVDVPSEAL
ncbi:MAG: hypothetical protein AB7G93_03220 [Bdellovibrionales bacterium]